MPNLPEMPTVEVFSDGAGAHSARPERPLPLSTSPRFGARKSRTAHGYRVRPVRPRGLPVQLGNLFQRESHSGMLRAQGRRIPDPAGSISVDFGHGPHRHHGKRQPHRGNRDARAIASGHAAGLRGGIQRVGTSIVRTAMEGTAFGAGGNSRKRGTAPCRTGIWTAGPGAAARRWMFDNLRSSSAAVDRQRIVKSNRCRIGT